MSILGVNGALAGAYQYANRTQKTGTNKSLRKESKVVQTKKQL